MSLFAVVVYILLIRFIITHYKTFLQGIQGFLLRKKINFRKYGDWAVVTGCTDGIGKAYARQLATKGLNIILISRNRKKLEAVQQEIQRENGVQVKIIVKDFSDGDDYGEIKKQLQIIDIAMLVNNVGMSPYYPKYTAEVTQEEINQMVNVNCKSALLMTHIVLPQMIAKRKGIIVNLSSTSTLQPCPLINIYGCTKSLVHQFSEALRYEYKRYNIIVQTVTPFYVSTNINKFSEKLQKVSMFIPDTMTYAKSAVDTIGVMDCTTGYLPHSLQFCAMQIIPAWVRSVMTSRIYNNLRQTYLKTRASTE